ncbi:MAG: hypothetical protein C5B50_13215 [Verrucomicrobia bacterium]|nr:MAG: hypothetical protein C5B50_13215 [Verrucomicrobiota bacterium]
MKIRWSRFNTYFVLALLLGLLCGCKSVHSKLKSAYAHLTLHIEALPDATHKTDQVAINRESPVFFNVDKEPFLTEKAVKGAKVIDAMGGFQLTIQFDRQGTWLLESYTTANKSKHFAIFCQWADLNDAELNKGRWLAAPKITAPIRDGIITFTPDASREDAEEIATGLNNVANKLGTAKEGNF